MFCAVYLALLFCFVALPEAKAVSEPVAVEVIDVDVNATIQKWRQTSWPKKNKKFRLEVINFIQQVSDVIQHVSKNCGCSESEPEVIVQEGNLALGKTASQSSECCGGEASRAVDGNSDPNWSSSSCTATAGGEAVPWWEVDLGDVYKVGRIVIRNRADCCPDRLSNVKVEVGTNDDDMRVCATLDRASTAGEEFTLTCPDDMAGQIVRVSMQNNQILTLCEVQVFAN